MPNSIVTQEHLDCVRSPKEITCKLWNVLDFLLARVVYYYSN